MHILVCWSERLSPRMRTQCIRRPTPWRVRSLNTCPQKRSCITCLRNLIYWRGALSLVVCVSMCDRMRKEGRREKSESTAKIEQREKAVERKRLETIDEKLKCSAARFRGRNCRDMHRARTDSGGRSSITRAVLRSRARQSDRYWREAKVIVLH